MSEHPTVELNQRWTADELGLPAQATVRTILALPKGELALGSDYGLVLWRRGHFMPFPFPKGARREMRRVESLAVHDGVLHVATMKGRFRWPFRGEAVGKGLPSDGKGGFDDLRALFSTPARLLEGWRTGLVGGEGPAESISFASAPDGRVFAGSLFGELVEVDGPALRQFRLRDKGRPVRHLAWAHQALWVASAEALHRWDGRTWSSREGEPYALHVDGVGRLWTLRAGGLWCSPRGDWPSRCPIPLKRPWALGSTDGALWVGTKGGLDRLLTD